MKRGRGAFHRQDLRPLDEFLPGAPRFRIAQQHRPRTDLSELDPVVHELQVPGACETLVHRDDFQERWPLL